MLRLTLPQQDFLRKQKLANDITAQLNIQTSDVQIHTREELHFIVGLLLTCEYNKVKESTLFEFLTSSATKKLHDLSVKDYVTTRAQLLSNGVIQLGINDEVCFVAIKEQFKIKIPRSDKLSEVAVQLRRFSQVLQDVGELNIEGVPTADRLSELLTILSEVNPGVVAEIQLPAAVPLRKRKKSVAPADDEVVALAADEQSKKANNRKSAQIARANIKKIRLATAEILKALGDQASALTQQVEVVVTESVVTPPQPGNASSPAAIELDDESIKSDASEDFDAALESAVGEAVEEVVDEAVGKVENEAVEEAVESPSLSSTIEQSNVSDEVAPYSSPSSPLPLSPLLDFSLFNRYEPQTLDKPLTDEEMEAQLQSWLSPTAGQ